MVSAAISGKIISFSPVHSATPIMNNIMRIDTRYLIRFFRSILLLMTFSVAKVQLLLRKSESIGLFFNLFALLFRQYVYFCTLLIYI